MYLDFKLHHRFFIDFLKATLNCLKSPSRWSSFIFYSLFLEIYDDPASSFFLRDSGISAGGGRGIANATLTPS